MDVSEQIKTFGEFIEQNYHDRLLERNRLGDNFIILDFIKLSRFNPELADLLLEQPEETLKAAELAVLNFDLPTAIKRFYVRIKNLPPSQKINIRDIRSRHIGLFFYTEGIVRQKSDVRPQVTTARFECPSCGNVIPVIQLESKFKEPSRCGCGRKGKFKLLSKELVDAQKIVLEEAPDDLDGADQPKRMDVFLKNDLVSPLSDKKTNPGTKIRIYGNVVEVPIPSNDGGKLVRFDLMIDANYIESIDEDFGELVITKEEEEEILALAKDPRIIQKLINSIAPSIYGHDKIKEAIIYQLLGGVRKERSDGAISRGDIHVLLIGDPGAGKSMLIKRAQTVAPKARYVSGKGASAAGLTASVVKDDFLKGWSLEAGALVLANRGFCITENSEILTDNSFKTIKQLYVDFLDHKKDKLLSIDYDSLKFIKTDIKGFSTREAEVFNITLENNDFLNITAEHPLLVWDNGYFWKKARDIKENDYIMTKRCFPLPKIYPFTVDLMPETTFAKIDLNRICRHINRSEICRILNIPRHRLESKNKLTIKDIKKICSYNEISFDDIKTQIKIKDLPLRTDSQLGELAGLILTDGHLSKKKGTICFFNRSTELIEKFISLSQDIFGITPSVHISRGDHRQAFFCSKEIHTLFQGLGIKKGNKSKTTSDLTNIRRMPKEFIESFLGGVINGDGCVAHRKSGGLIQIVGGNEGTLEDIRKTIRPLGILAKIQAYTAYGGGVVSKRKTTLYRLSITGIDNFKRIPIRYLTKEKSLKLKTILRSKDISSKVPNVYRLFKTLNNKIPHSEKKILYNNSVRLANLRTMRLSRTVFEKTTKELAEVNPAKYTDEIKLFKQIIDQDMIFLKVCTKKRCGIKEVYNLQVDMSSNPNYFANFIPVHNCMIDELDKMTPEDRSAMHEALEQQTVTISKANIQATLRCETTVLAAANPKFGRFDPYELVAKQINLPPALISRFDLIFPIRDLPNEEQDTKLAGFLLNLHKTNDVAKVEIDTVLLRKFISYARRYCNPKLTDGAIEELQDYYVKLRNAGGDDAGVRSVPITARQLEALVRLGEASAKTRLSDKVTKRDAKKAIEILYYCMSQVGIDPETGKIDIDVLTTGVSSSARSHIMTVKEAISDLENKIGKTIPIDELVKDAQEKGVDADKVEEILEKLKRSGDIFEPRKGFVQRL